MLVAVGAVTVLFFAPTAHKPAAAGGGGHVEAEAKGGGGQKEQPESDKDATRRDERTVDESK